MTPLEKDKRILDFHARQFDIIGKALEKAQMAGKKKVTIPKAHCTKCGESILGSENSLCSRCV